MSTEAWIVYLEQINERVRWYGAQFWQVSFAYVIFSGGGVAAFGGSDSEVAAMDGRSFGWFCLAVGCFGVFVLMHLGLLYANWARNVKEGVLVAESELGITAKATHQLRYRSHQAPLFLAVFITAAVMLSYGIALLAR